MTRTEQACKDFFHLMFALMVLFLFLSCVAGCGG